MTELQLYRRTATGFIPDSEAAQEFFGKCKIGETVELKGKRPRNVDHHRKFWKLLQIVADNSDMFDNAEQVSFALKAILGHGEWVHVPKASKPLFIPHSISFSAMDQIEFDKFYREATAAVCKYLLVGMDEDVLIREIASF